MELRRYTIEGVKGKGEVVVVGTALLRRPPQQKLTLAATRRQTAQECRPYSLVNHAAHLFADKTFNALTSLITDKKLL